MADMVLQNVSKRFGNISAVADLSLTVHEGEFVVLLGPTGAGKTTTLRLIAGLETPDAGRILSAGADTTNAPIASRDVAFVFQQYSLYPHYSVYDNLAFPLRSPLRRQSETEIRQRVGQIAELLRISNKLNNKATQLSGGEMQRVAIGRALVRSPRIFLMDEPLSSLDAKLREDLRLELKRIQTDLGATVLYVTHDQIEAMTLADRIGVLSAGRLIQLAAPKTMYTQPASIYVAQRLGSPPLNLVPATLAELFLPALSLPAGTAQIGVRPEDVRLGQGTLTGTVVQVEHLGAETVVLLDIAGQTLHALADPSAQEGARLDAGLRPGAQIALSSPPQAALFFDHTGYRLEASA